MSETILSQREGRVPRTGRSAQFRTPAVMTAPARFAKNTTQGACAGLLTLAGATQISGTAFAADELALASLGSIENLGAQLVMGNFTGLLQIVGAAALFFTAGKGFARVIGLMVFVAAATAYFNGVAPADIVERTRAVYDALGPAYAAFQANLMGA
ncbi:MAG: hypothetical protein AAFW81_11395 [Pseudomonadota bacterium]